MENGVKWEYFDKFEEIDDQYLPDQGEGENMATQVVTAVTKLVYKWYNDGDVFDNTHGMDGWCNDLSSYANWLHTYIPSSRPVLEYIYEIYMDFDYERLLKNLADLLLRKSFLKELESREKIDSIYECTGPFEFEEYSEDDDW